MKLRLALYSDQIIPANAAVDRRLLDLIGVDRPRIAYVSSAPDPDRSYFSAKRRYYEQLGVELGNSTLTRLTLATLSELRIFWRVTLSTSRAAIRIDFFDGCRRLTCLAPCANMPWVEVCLSGRAQGHY